MVITDIQSQKKKGRYNLFVDGVFYSGIDAETLVKSALKKGSEIEKPRLEELVKSSEARSAFDKAINILSRGEQTKKDIKQKLLKYGYKESIIDEAIKKAEEYGYINDKEYAKMLVKAKSLKSRKEIKYSLYTKGIDRNIVDEVSETISDNEESERAIAVASKYMKNKEVNSKSLAGLYAYLYRKGFMVDSIKRALKEYKIDDFDGDLLW